MLYPYEFGGWWRLGGRDDSLKTGSFCAREGRKFGDVESGFAELNIPFSTLFGSGALLRRIV